MSEYSIEKEAKGIATLLHLDNSVLPLLENRLELAYAEGGRDQVVKLQDKMKETSEVVS